MRAMLKKVIAILMLAGLAGTPCLVLAQTPPAAVPVGQDYRLGAGDKLRLIVFGEESLSGEFVVSSSGVVALPLIGDVQAQGQTVGQLQDKVTRALSDGYLKDARVSLEVLNFRPFYILGEVNHPGTYPYTSGMTVMMAVATAQGFTYRANKKKVFIKRATDAREREVTLASDVTVEAGDVIRIGERHF